MALRLSSPTKAIKLNNIQRIGLSIRKPELDKQKNMEKKLKGIEKEDDWYESTRAL